MSGIDPLDLEEIARKLFSSPLPICGLASESAPTIRDELDRKVLEAADMILKLRASNQIRPSDTYWFIQGILNCVSGLANKDVVDGLSSEAALQQIAGGAQCDFAFILAQRTGENNRISHYLTWGFNLLTRESNLMYVVDGQRSQLDEAVQNIVRNGSDCIDIIKLVSAYLNKRGIIILRRI